MLLFSFNQSCVCDFKFTQRAWKTSKDVEVETLESAQTPYNHDCRWWPGMEYLTISKLHVNKLSEANSSSCWKWLKIIHRGNNSEIYSFQISENREHFVASSASVCHFFFAKNRNTQLLCCGLELPIRGFTESVLCRMWVWKWNEKKN